MPCRYGDDIVARKIHTFFVRWLQSFAVATKSELEKVRDLKGKTYHQDAVNATMTSFVGSYASVSNSVVNR